MNIQNAKVFVQHIHTTLRNHWIIPVFVLVTLAFACSQQFSIVACFWLGLALVRMAMERSKTVFFVTVVLGLLWGTRAFLHHRAVQQFERVAIDQPYQAIVELDPFNWKINGDLLTGQGVIELSGDTDTIKNDVAFIYRITSEEEQAYFLKQTRPITVYVTVQRQLVEGNRNRHGFNYADYLQGKQLFAQFKIVTIHALSEQTSWVANMQTLRNELIQRIVHYSDSNANAFASALLLGDKDELNQEQQDHYKRLGISHLLAISGLHISILMVLFLQGSWRIGVTRETSYVMLIGVLLSYGWLLGWSISSTRAILMGIFVLIKKRWHKSFRFNQWDFFAWVTGIVLICQPFIVLNIAFQLSYGMTFVVLFIQSALRYTNYIRSYQALIRVAFISLYVIPLLAMHFFEFNVLSGALTVLFTYGLAHLVLPVLFVYMASIVVHFEMVANACEAIVDVIVTNCDAFLSWLARFNLFMVVTGYGSVWLWSFYIVVVSIALYAVARQTVTLKRILIFSISVVFLIGSASWHIHHRVIFIDVQQGDATAFIQQGRNRVILIDTGGVGFSVPQKEWQQRKSTSFADNTIIPALKAEGISEIEYLILTHADSDHIGNVRDLAQQLTIHHIVVAKGMENVEEIQQLAQSLPPFIQWKFVSAGDTLQYGSLLLQFLGPHTLSDGTNETSLSMSIYFMQKQWLLLGDLAMVNEEELLAHYPNLKTDFLKVAHHGSRFSTSSKLLQALQSNLAIISAGKNNRYHHPNEEVLQRLDDAEVHYMRTDQQGAIHFVEQFDHSLRVETILTKESGKVE